MFNTIYYLEFRFLDMAALKMSENNLNGTLNKSMHQRKIKHFFKHYTLFTRYSKTCLI